MDQRSEPAASERGNPVDPVVGPESCRNSRPKTSGRIHSCTCKRNRGQVNDQNGKANWNWGESASGVTSHSSGKHNEHEHECHHEFQGETHAHGHVRAKPVRAQVALRRVRNNVQEQQSRDDCSHQLANDIHGPFDGIHLAGQDSRERDSRVQVATRDSCSREDQKRYGDAMTHRNCYKPGGAGATIGNYATCDH